MVAKSIQLGAIGLAALVLTAPVANAADVLIKVGSVLPPVDKVWYPHITRFIERANAAGKAHGIQLKMVAAGFKAMPAFEMGNAVRTGVLDLAHVPGTYYNKLLPLADGQKLSTLSVQEQRKNGAIKFARKIYAKQMNVYFLGRWSDAVPFHFYLTKKIDPTNMKGIKIRGTSVYQPLIEALGGTMISMPPSQAYTALERGVVDGFGWPLWGIKAWGWQKLVKYRVDPGFYTAELSVLVNLDTWKKLTKAQQNVLEQAQIQLEDEFIKFRARTNESEKKMQAAAGIKVIRLEGAALKKFMDTATRVGWEDVLKKDPVNAPMYRKLTTK